MIGGLAFFARIFSKSNSLYQGCCLISGAVLRSFGSMLSNWMMMLFVVWTECLVWEVRSALAALDMLLNGFNTGSVEWGVSGNQLENEYAKRPEIHGAIMAFACSQLRCKISRRAAQWVGSKFTCILLFPKSKVESVFHPHFLLSLAKQIDRCYCSKRHIQDGCLSRRKEREGSWLGMVRLEKELQYGRLIN